MAARKGKEMEEKKKSMTKDEFEKKGYWRPSKTITISLGYDDKAGDELYQKFLSYCGGERDIRD